jgi:DNA polymerase III epsilon subunit-like protein
LIRVIDIETTGTDPAADAIIEIASVDLLRGGGITSVSIALVMPPPRTMSTLAISMIASVAGSIPVVSMSMTRINRCASWLADSKSRSRRLVPSRRT